MNDFDRSARLLRVAVGLVEPGDTIDDQWAAWVELARTERVLPLLHRIVLQNQMLLSAPVVTDARAIVLDVMATMVRYEHDLLEVAEILGHHFPFAVLKGAATAHLDYDDPSMRQFGDVDLLVASANFDRAIQVLGAQGWTQAYPLPRHHERFTHAVTLRNSKRVEVDLHRRIAHRALGELIPTSELLTDTVGYEIAGRSLRALSQRDRLVHAAIHSLTSRGEYSRLSSSADVLVLATATSGSAAEVLARADSWRVGRLVNHAIELAYSAAQMPIPNGWLSASERVGGRGDRIVERAYLTENRRAALEELAYLRLIQGWRDRYDYVRGYFATDSEYSLRRHRSGLLEQSRYLWSRLRSD